MHFHEKFDIGKLALVKRCNNLPLTKPDELEDPNWKDIFERSLKEYNGDINYAKAKGKEYGRYFCDGKYGYQKFPREIRNYLAKDFYIDLDIKNCHLVILEQLFRRYNIDIPETLNTYNTNRNAFIQKYNFKDGKLFMIKFINNDHCYDNKFIDFHTDIYNKLVPLLITDYQEIYNDILKKDKKKNVNGSFLANVLQDIENDILMSMMETCNSHNIEIGALCFDGLLIEKSDFNIKLVMEENVLRDLNYVITVEEKSMETDWKPSEDEDEIDEIDLTIANRDTQINDHFIKKYNNGNIVNIKYKGGTIIGKILNNKDLRVEHFRHNEHCKGDLFYNININRDFENKISTAINCKKCGYNHSAHQCDNSVIYNLIYNNIVENSNELTIIINNEKQLDIVDNKYINSRLYLALSQADAYISEILYEEFKNKYILIKNTWYISNGVIWEESDENIPTELLQYIKEIKDNIVNIYNKHKEVNNLSEKELELLCKITSNLSKKILRSNEDISYVTASKKDFSKPNLVFNKNSNLIAFQNGVYDLDQMIFRKGDPNDYLTIQMSYDFILEENITQKQYLIQFLEDILPIKEVRNFLLHNVASCLLGDTNKEQEFYILTGKKGANGKSVLSNLIEDTFGEFYAAPEPTLLTKPREKANEANEALKDLIGKRIAIISEPDKRDKIMASNLKKFTGCDTMTVRGNHEKSQKMSMKMKFFMLCNSIPLLDDCKDAEIRRLCVINFPTRFCENPVRPNEKKIDITVPQKLKECKCEFFKLLLSYLVEYKKVSELGHKIQKPIEVTKQLDNYIQRNKSDVDEFIETYLEYSEGSKLHCKEVYELFENWCIEENKEKIKRKDLDDLIESIFEIEIKKYTKIHGVKNYGWENIKLIQRE
jgi:P4 family phage/plasmid primase-like protien